MKKRQVLVFLFVLIVGFIFIWTSAFSEDVEEEGLWIFNESLSTEDYAVYSNGSQQKAVFSGDYDKYRLENGSLAQVDYNINNFKVEKSRFVVELGSKTPSVNFTFKSNSLKFKFVGWGIYDPVDDDFWLSQEYNDIIPVVDGNKIFYDQIVGNISVSYEINRTGANKLITFTQKSRDSLPPAFSNSSFIFFAEKIEGDLPKVNSSWGNMFFDDVFIPEYPDVFKKVFHYQGNDYLLTAIHFSFYNSSEFPFSIDPTLKPSGGGCSSTPCIFGSWGDLSGSGDSYNDVIIEDSATVYVGADNCSQADASPAMESDCTWYVNISGTFYIEDGSLISGIGRGRFGSDGNYVDGVGAGGDYKGESSGGGGGGGYGDGGKGGDVAGDGGDSGTKYNQTVPADYGSLYPAWSGSGGGAGDLGASGYNDGGNGGAGIYVEADNISFNGDGRIDMSGGTGDQAACNDGSGGGGSPGSIIIRARNHLEFGNTATYFTLISEGGDGGINTCSSGTHATGGGSGGGWIELHYANFINLSKGINIEKGYSGLCTIGAENCRNGANGTDGSFYDGQFNIAPNFTAIPSMSGISSLGSTITLHSNISSQSPINANDYISACDFSVRDSEGYFHVNHSNGTVYGEQDWFNWTYQYTLSTSATYYWNVTCYDLDDFNTLDDGKGIAVIDGGEIASIVVDDATIPDLEIVDPEEDEAFTSTSIYLEIMAYDVGTITDRRYTIGGVDCGTESHIGCLTGQNENQTFTCTNSTSCYANANIVGNASAGSGLENLQFYVVVYDSNGNLNESTVNFTVTVPSPPITVPPGGGGGVAPIMAVVPFCGDGECQAEAGENIFTCRLDCATLSRLTTGELLKEGLVVQYIIYLLVILALLVTVEVSVYQHIGRYFRRKWFMIRRMVK